MTINEISVGIIDDDHDFVTTLSLFLKQIGVKEIKTACTFQAGKALIDSMSIDFVLLDVDLQKGDFGIELGHYIRENAPEMPIIYFTNNYNDEVYQVAKVVKPNAFLDKNLNELKVRQAIELSMADTRKFQSGSVLIPNVEQFSIGHIFVKIGTSFKKISLKQVEYIVYSEQYANLVIEGKKIPLNITMKDLIKKLPNNTFVQVHQSYIINKEHIVSVNTTNSQVDVAGCVIPIGKTYKKALLNELMFLT